MGVDPVRRRVVRTRRSRAARIAAALWILWAFIVWNVVFDRVIVLAGRRYVQAAAVAARGGDPYLRIDDWMRPAATRGLWLACAAGGGILAVGLVSIALASRRPHTEDSPWEPSSIR